MSTQCQMLDIFYLVGFQILGIQLRKGEERRLKTEQKQQKSGQLDVQSIMEAAFELRRKQLEENDSDRDGDDDVDNWSDD